MLPKQYEQLPSTYAHLSNQKKSPTFPTKTKIIQLGVAQVHTIQQFIKNNAITCLQSAINQFLDSKKHNFCPHTSSSENNAQLKPKKENKHSPRSNI